MLEGTPAGGKAMRAIAIALLLSAAVWLIVLSFSGILQ